MKNKKNKLVLIIIISLFIIVLLSYKAISNYETRQVSLPSLPFSFSDLKLYETSDKLHDIYVDAKYNGEMPYYANSLEFSCNQYYKSFSLLSRNDTSASYIFHENNLIKKNYYINDGGILLNYIRDKLIEEFGAPIIIKQPSQTTSGKVSLAGLSSPSTPEIQSHYKWDMGDYLIDISTVSYSGGKNVNLQISFTIKDNILVDLANNKLYSKLSDIDSLRFDQICTFYNGYSIGRISGNWALLDQNNNEARIYKGFDVYDYSYAHYGLLVLRNKSIQNSSLEHLYRFIDINGNILIDNVSHYKRSSDGSIIVVTSQLIKDSLMQTKNSIVYTHDDTYSVVPTDFESIGYFSDDGYALAYSGSNHDSPYKLIDRQSSIIHEYKESSIFGYNNGSTLLLKRTTIVKPNKTTLGEWYYVVADKYGNTLTKNENGRNHNSHRLNAEELFDKYGLLENHFYIDGKCIEKIVENSKGEIIYKDTTEPFSYLEMLHGVLRADDSSKELYYDHSGMLIDGVIQCMAIPSNAYYRNIQPPNDRVNIPYILKEYTQAGESNLTSLGDFYYTYLKTSKGDRLYSYKGLQYAFAEEYELNIDKCLYSDNNILIVAKNKTLNKYGVVDISGNIVFDFKYDDIQSIVAADKIQIGDDLFDTKGNRASGGFKAVEYRYNSAIIKDSLGFYVLDLSGKPVIKNIRIIE